MQILAEFPLGVSFHLVLKLKIWVGPGQIERAMHRLFSFSQRLLIYLPIGNNK